MKTEEDEKEIEATKAPLMEHLIELRSRLIKALVAFFLTFIVCFAFAGDIYNVLIWPFEWIAGSENTRFIYTALLEYFITQIKLAMFGAAFPALYGAECVRTGGDYHRNVFERWAGLHDGGYLP